MDTPDALQEHHHLLDRLLFLPGGGDQPGALRPEVGHLDEPLRCRLDHVEGGHPEVVHDLLGQLRADALDQPGAEVAQDALHRGGQHGGVVLDVELPAVLRVGAPPAAQPQRLAGLGAQQRPDHGDQVTPAAGIDLRDGVAVVFVGIGDPFQRRLQSGQRDRRRDRHRHLTCHTAPAPTAITGRRVRIGVLPDHSLRPQQSTPEADMAGATADHPAAPQHERRLGPHPPSDPARVCTSSRCPDLSRGLAGSGGGVI